MRGKCQGFINLGKHVSAMLNNRKRCKHPWFYRLTVPACGGYRYNLLLAKKSKFPPFPPGPREGGGAVINDWYIIESQLDS